MSLAALSVFILLLVLLAVVAVIVRLLWPRLREWWEDREEERVSRETDLPRSVDDPILPVLSALNQPIIVLDADDDVERASRLAYAYGLISHDEIVLPELSAMIGALRAGRGPQEEELTIARGPHDGAGTFTLQLRVAALTGERVLILIKDLTAERRVEEMRRDFIANASSELNNPVHYLASLASEVEAGLAAESEVKPALQVPAPAMDGQGSREGMSAEPAVADGEVEIAKPASGWELAEKAHRLARESRRLERLVERIVDLSRVQDQDAIIASEQLEVDELLAETIERVRATAEERGIELVSGGERGLVVWGEMRLLSMALRNLLDNAVRYSEPGSRVSVGVSRRRPSALSVPGRAGDSRSEMRVTASPTTVDSGAGTAGTSPGQPAAPSPTELQEGELPEQLRIAVVDQGIGIDRAEQDRVWERFYRGQQARKLYPRGVGLGLSLARHIAADHGGGIELWSTPGRGSTFTLVLPLDGDPAAPSLSRVL